MADRQFLQLSERWALAHDSLQWIIQRRGGFDKTRGRWNWQAESFISSNRDILVLTLREKGAVIDPGKMEEVLALPYTFKEWIGRRQGREAAGRRRGEVNVAAKSLAAGEMSVLSARSRAGPVFRSLPHPGGCFFGFRRTGPGATVSAGRRRGFAGDSAFHGSQGGSAAWPPSQNVPKSKGKSGLK